MRKLRFDITEETVRMQKTDYRLFAVRLGRLRHSALVPLSELTDAARMQARDRLSAWAYSQRHF